MKKIFLSFIFLLLGLFTATQAFACTCEAVPIARIVDGKSVPLATKTTEEEIKEEFNKSSLVFQAKL